MASRTETREVYCTAFLPRFCVRYGVVGGRVFLGGRMTKIQLPKALEEMDVDTIMQAIIADEPDLAEQQASLPESLLDIKQGRVGRKTFITGDVLVTIQKRMRDE